MDYSYRYVSQVENDQFADMQFQRGMQGLHFSKLIDDYALSAVYGQATAGGVLSVVNFQTAAAELCCDATSAFVTPGKFFFRDFDGYAYQQILSAGVDLPNDSYYEEIPELRGV